jgi:hypothetical protein
MSEGPASEIRDSLTRRRFISGSAAAGAALAAGGVLAACGSSSSTTTSAAKTTATGTGTGTSAATTAASGQLGTELQTILGKPTNLLAKGPGQFNMAAQLALTGAGSVYGQLQGAGWRYGVQHVAAWTQGKLLYNTTFYDNKSGIPAAEAAAGRQAGLSGTPVFLNSYIFGFGAVIPFAKQFKMFCPDPGGGAGPIPGPFASQPYCYGFRASYPTDVLDGPVKYMKQKFPAKTKWVLVQPVIAPPYNNAVASYAKNLFSQYGVTEAGQVLAPLGATDYSATISKIKSLNPDIVMWTTFGTDVAYQAREMISQGLTNVTNVGIDFNPVLAKLAGPAIKGWYFGFDYLNTVKPPNKWSQFFVTNWQKDHGGELPSFYNAADYITAFAVARLMDDILASGGDIRSGDAYVKALNANPTFDHVYGGSDAALGKMTIDTTTHSPKSITMLLFTAAGTGNVADITPVATYNVKAADFALI